MAITRMVLSRVRARYMNTLAGGIGAPTPPELKDVAKVQLLQRESPSRVKEIWDEHHKDSKNAAGLVMTSDELLLMKPRMRECPYFIFPVRRDQGFFMLFSEFQGNQCSLTFLEDYKKNPKTAQPYMTMRIYEDLLVSKGLALMRGDVGGMMTKKEGQKVLELIRRFYIRPEEFVLVQQFNQNPRQFNFNEYMRKCP